MEIEGNLPVLQAKANKFRAKKKNKPRFYSLKTKLPVGVLPNTTEVESTFNSSKMCHFETTVYCVFYSVKNRNLQDLW